jgi:hypothetical protein
MNFNGDDDDDNNNNNNNNNSLIRVFANSKAPLTGKH